MNALDSLSEWSRKYYKYRIETCGNVQPGDGISVHLEAGGRKVSVYEEDLAHKDDEPRHVSIDEVILEAIRLWHADSSMKKYHCFWSHEDSYPPYESDTVNKVIWTKGVYHAVIHAINEQEAKAKILSGYPKDFDRIVKVTLYERQDKKQWNSDMQP